MAADAPVDRHVPHLFHRPPECRLRETGDGACARYDRGGVWPWSIAFLHWLPAVRSAQHACAASFRRTHVARPHHDYVGHRDGADGVHEVAAGFLFFPLCTWRGRSGVLSRRYLLPDAVVSAKLSDARARLLYA